MMPEKCSTKLKKIGCEKYELSLQNFSKSLLRTNFQHIAFHEDEETLVAIDTKGIGYLLQFISSDWCVKTIGPIGQSTFVAFNPTQRSELIVGLTSKNIKVLNTNGSSPQKFCALEAHQVPAIWISFYKNYCLTASRKEAVIWDLRTAQKIHQLRLETQKSSIKKALISPTGIIAALYENDTIQSWPFELFTSENRISLPQNGVRNAKDFIFTPDGRSLIVCGEKRRILVFCIKSWALMRNLELPDGNSVARRLFVVPRALESVCSTAAILFEDGSLRFFDLETQLFLPTTDLNLAGIRKAVVSPKGQWLATISFDGSLIISSIDHLITPRTKTLKKPESSERKPNGFRDRLKDVRDEFKVELQLTRLLPILREFGEYPERYRATIWKNLLKLSENRAAYLRLSEKDVVEKEVDVLRAWKLADKSKEMLLSVTIERLVQFCPLLGQTPFLPELIFPFVVVFQKDPITGFEAILMILWNFCQKWLEYHPLPPINILGIIENILAEVDPILTAFYCQNGVTSTEYAWPLLKTCLTEVLEGNEWMILWDHLITFGRPSMLIFSVVAYSICNREAILGILEEKEEFDVFFVTQGHLKAKQIIKMAEKIDGEVSKKNHPKKYLRDTLKFLPGSGPYPPFLLKEYPKFLVGDLENSRQLMGMKQEELMLKEQRRLLAKELEEKRLKEESENFFREIHQRRLNELQRCYNEQLKLTKISLDTERQKLTELSSENLFHSSKRIHSKSEVKKTKKIRRKPKKMRDSCEKLREDVDTLDEQVHTFLENLRGSR